MADLQQLRHLADLREMTMIGQHRHCPRVTLAVIALFWQHQKHGLIGNDGAPAGGGGGAKPSGDKKK